MTSAADVDAVTAANQELYAAFEVADLDRMEAVWDDTDDVRCIHPGWPALIGRARVMRSWSVLMANTSYIQFFLTGVTADVDEAAATIVMDDFGLAAESVLDGGDGLADARVVGDLEAVFGERHVEVDADEDALVGEV